MTDDILTSLRAERDAATARTDALATALRPFANVAYLVSHHRWALECLDLSAAHFDDAHAALNNGAKTDGK